MGYLAIPVSNVDGSAIRIWSNFIFCISINKSNKQILMTKKEKAFVDYVKSECKKYGIKCSLRPVKYLKLSGNIKCSGYFDDWNMVLACATNKKDWLSILVHEYAHLTQWVDKCKIWNTVSKFDSVGKMDSWLNGESVKGYKRHIDLVKELELDNEKRSVKIIKDFGLDSCINVEDYIRKANAYIQFYNYIKTTRRWSDPKNSPYTNKTVIQAMPKVFRMNYKKMSKRAESAFLKSKI
jgi:hypothetical protein